MGVGRRMQKQGPPEALSEEHFARLKRKAGIPVDQEAPTSDAHNKKKRRTSREAPAKKTKPNPKSAPAPAADSDRPPKPKGVKPTVKPKGGNSEPLGVRKANGAGNAKPGRSKAKALVEEDDEMSDGLGSGLEDLDDLDGSDADVMADDFLDSDDSVYDSDGPQQKAAMFSDDEDDSDAEERLTAANIAGLSRKLDEQKAQEEADAQAELEEAALQTNIEVEKPRVLGGGDDGDDEDADLALKTKSLLAPDLQLLRTRINDTIRVLDDFATLSEEGRSRAEYTSQLVKDICAYYGYSEFLAEKLYNLFTPREAFAFFEANESARPVVIRTNTLRTHRRDLAQALINRGVTLEPVGKWSKVGLQIFESNVPLGATPEYLAGHYILQAASSFLPVMALGPQEHERVLDMASAPGGKTTHMAALMKNTGCIFANDPSKSRSRGLIGNVHRLGCRNVVVCNYDARDFPRVIGGFDRVLLDAPCSGTGVIAKDQSVKTNKTERDFMLLPHTQKQLVLSAIDSVNHASRTGGYVVYSTCSVTVEENEQVVQYALNKRPNVRLVETGLAFGKEGFTSYMGKKFDAAMRHTRRYYPHSYNVDGFFVAKFQKVGPTPPNLVAKGTKDSGGGKQSGGAAESSSSAPLDEDEVVDKTPIAAEGEEEDSGDFGGFDDDADAEYMEKAKRNAMRRRGLDPRALEKGKKQQQQQPQAPKQQPQPPKDEVAKKVEEEIKAKPVAAASGKKKEGKSSKGKKKA